MERWPTSLLALGLALALASAASADPPSTTVVFGTPSLAMMNIDAPGADDRGRSTSAPPAALRTDRACPPPVTVTRRFPRGRERVRMPLLDCDRAPRPEALRALSLLARPRSLERAPTEDELRAWRESGGDPSLLAPDVHALHPGLLERLQRIGEAFTPHPIEIVSGYRPDSRSSSRHHHGRALDLVVRGVSREALRDLVVTFPETGVGWYPNSVFVHVDVREESAYWVDLSGPGERPRYVRGAAPPEPSPAAEEAHAGPSADELERLRRETLDALGAIHVPPPG